MTLVFYDFETTGLNPFHDKIIEYAFLSGHESITSLVKRTKELKPEIVKITGIENEMLKENGISELQAKKNIMTWIKSLQQKNGGLLYLVAHNNIGFDMIFFKKLFPEELQFINTHIRFLDSLYLAKVVMPRMRSFSMKTLTKIFGIESGNHRALGDTIALKKVYAELIKKIHINFRNVDSVYELVTV